MFYVIILEIFQHAGVFVVNVIQCQDEFDFKPSSAVLLES